MTNNSIKLSINKEKRIRGEVKKPHPLLDFAAGPDEDFFLRKCIKQKIGMRIEPRIIWLLFQSVVKSVMRGANNGHSQEIYH